MVVREIEKQNSALSPQKDYARRPLLDLRIPADPQSAPQARHRVEKICHEAGISDDECFALDLALGEALANAVVHGKPALPRADGFGEDICICVWDFHDRLIVEIHDHGPGFDPPAPPYAMPPADAQDTHGRGLPLMERLVDALMICRCDYEEGGASVYLVKNRAARENTQTACRLS
jgi:anti-sigma regulatory factor (Ser/Thr protein kinase)